MFAKTFGDFYRGLGYKQDYENFKNYGFTRGNAPWWVRFLIKGFEDFSDEYDRDMRRRNNLPSK